MRKKLINILSTAGWNLFEGGEQTKREIADHLIANGVTVQGEIDANTYQLMRKCERLKEQNESLANAVNVLEEINSDLYKKLKGVTVQKWIPVTERLPEDWVLCACVDGEVNILCYDYIMDDWDIWGGPNSCYGKPFVTHWMPLPEAPKGE